MIINKIPVFPTLILNVSNFIDEKKCKEIYDILIKKESKNLHKKNKALDDKSTTTHSYSSNILSKIDKNIKIKIHEFVKKYSEDSGMVVKNLITNSWFNIQNKNSVLKEHTHPQTIIAGSLYINVGKNCSPICFQNPNPYITYTDIEKSTEYSFSWIKFYPKNGDLFLWPAWLTHGSFNEKNMYKNRTVISFNIN